MGNKFVALTEGDLTFVYGGKGKQSCVKNFLRGLAEGAIAGAPGGVIGIVGGANLGMVGGAITCL
ncbi:MAG: bacteriocin leader domain-containing protein [Ligilactobacillus animalis]|uniref:bacteriocin leader domain-containing protein n=1 Tax=Ligilactobacillus animalis TaxID=1605 RepID=UPI00242E02E4|nr:bacteriocin leader domain-containing protein [Ligilactobacillus animalis]MCI5941806.1 bacteriocin leader domain-containing protein [Ligilactobacillus animalis]MDY2993492.1 bacteriocin leader domain-containing protein [Ligilactobacillus animalis]